MMLSFCNGALAVARDLSSIFGTALDVRATRPVRKSYRKAQAAMPEVSSRCKPHLIAPILSLLGLLALVLPTGSASAAAPTLSETVMIVVEGGTTTNFMLAGSDLDGATLAGFKGYRSDTPGKGWQVQKSKWVC